MKKLIILALCHIVFTVAATAQLQRADVKKNTVVTNRTLPGTITKLPNLIVKISRISYSTSENTYTIHYTVHNEGADISQSAIRLQGGVFNSAGSMIHAGGSEDVPVKYLKQGESYKGQITYSIPLYLWQKKCTYKLEADPDNKIQEANEKDNSAVASIEGYLDLPDLVIESATFIYQDSIMQNGQWKHRFKIRYVLKNNATVPASLDVYVGGLLGPTPRAGCTALVSGMQPPSNVKIGPWGTITKEIGCTADRSALGEGATYTLTINHPKTIEEKDLNNNSFTINIPAIK